MSRGNKEQECFDYIRGILFHKDAFNYSFDKFDEGRILLTKCPSRHLFAMSSEDIKKIENLFWSAIANPNKSEFPDFVSNHGYIEHFQITSAEITEAGSKHRKAMSKYEKECIQKEEQLNKSLNINPSHNEIKTVTLEFHYGIHSHANLIQSLHINMEHHIESSHKYVGNKDCRVFIIEYDELKLSMAINYEDIMPNVCYGDLLRDDAVEYRISRDKVALRYLYENRGDIDYVIFVTEFCYEIINVANILEILKLLPFSYNIYPVPMSTVSLYQGFSIPLKKDSKEDKIINKLFL